MNLNVLFVSFLVTVKVRARRVTVKGPRGILIRSFKHMMIDIHMVGKSQLKVIKWFGKRKELAAVNTVCSHIENMIKGVTKVNLLFVAFNLSPAE